MFTGIVQAACELVALEKKPGLFSLAMRLPERLLGDLNIGASIALDGVCMTVTAIDGDVVSFDAMQETLGLTTLGGLEQGACLNVERSFKQGVEVGGHIISGHIDGMAVVSRIETSDNNKTVYYQVPVELMKYIFKKGFIGANGCSLTVADVDRATNEFSICYIPETLRVTTHAVKQVGDQVNIEVDRQTQAVVDTVERLLQDNPEFLIDLLNR